MPEAGRPVVVLAVGLGHHLHGAVGERGALHHRLAVEGAAARIERQDLGAVGVGLVVVAQAQFPARRVPGQSRQEQGRADGDGRF